MTHQSKTAHRRGTPVTPPSKAPAHAHGGGLTHALLHLIHERKQVNITIDDIIARYGSEVAKLTQRAILAEARADAAEARLAEQDEQPDT